MSQLSENPNESLYLERRDPARNMARFYRLELDRDLFGTVLACRRWGRIGTFGQTRAEHFVSEQEAISHLRRLEQLKRRRGYCERGQTCTSPTASSPSSSRVNSTTTISEA